MSDQRIGTELAGYRIESPEEVAAVLRAAMPYASTDRIYGCTNCGLAPLPRHVAVGKLNALAAGAALLRKEVAR